MMYLTNSDFGFKVNAYTNFNSCMQLSVYRNIILSHLFRIKNLCSGKFKSHKEINM